MGVFTVCLNARAVCATEDSTSIAQVFIAAEVLNIFSAVCNEHKAVCAIPVSASNPQVFSAAKFDLDSLNADFNTRKAACAIELRDLENQRGRSEEKMSRLRREAVELFSVCLSARSLRLTSSLSVCLVLVTTEWQDTWKERLFNRPEKKFDVFLFRIVSLFHASIRPACANFAQARCTQWYSPAFKITGLSTTRS